MIRRSINLALFLAIVVVFLPSTFSTSPVRTMARENKTIVSTNGSTMYKSEKSTGIHILKT